MKLTLTILFSLFSLNINANAIIEVEKGLTLAQIKIDEVFNTLAVIEDNGDNIKAINISRISGTPGDITTTYRTLGYNGIVKIITDNKITSLNNYPYSQLASPAGDSRHHIALGFNYAEHADEVKQEHRPFLFLKTARATREQRIETDNITLLDYEVEICARPLADIDNPKNQKDIVFGFFICGDFTDRAELMRNINLDDMQSGVGFSGAKSRTGYFPTGPYMVIPKDRDKFLNTASFSLHRNGVLKQSSSTSKMIWSLKTIIEEIFYAQYSEKFTHSNQSNNWLINGKITSEIVLLTGTPEGVIMQAPSLSFKMLGGITYVFSGAIFDIGLQEHVVESYVQKLLDNKIFLQPDEHITLKGSFIGQIDLKITSCSSDNNQLHSKSNNKGQRTTERILF